MQDTGTTPLQSPGVLGALTTVHLALIAVLAIITIIGILYGMKLARQRRQGTRELEDAGHLERTGETPAADPDTPGAPVESDAGDVQRRIAPERIVEARAAVVPVPEPVAASPAPVVAPAPVVDAVAETDLTRLKGLGPKVAAMLVEQGIPDIATLARLDDAQADAVAAQLGTFAPRMSRDRWVEQARLLAAGDIAGFEAIFGKL